MSSARQPPLARPGRTPTLTFTEHLGIPHPDWEPFFDALESAAWPPDTLKRAVLDWTARLAASFEEPCEVLDAGYVVIVAGDRGRGLAEAAGRITTTLDRFMGDAGDGATAENPHVIIEAPSLGEFLDMLDHWYRDAKGGVRGSVAACVGMEDYCHILMPPESIETLEETLAHQLFCTYLRAYVVPTWFLQGLASEFMNVHFEVPFEGLDPERKREHLGHWDSTTIQSFWDGAAFDSLEQECDLAYELAHVITHQILRLHRPLVGAFLSEAEVNDAGGAAARALFGAPIEGLVADFLGPGDWAPTPVASGQGP